MSTNKPHQRTGSVSNAHVGRKFEGDARKFLEEQGVHLDEKSPFPLDVGVSRKKKRRNFDLGSESEKVVVECKSHRWTKGDNMPSAKVTNWNEAMHYFLLCPGEYRKIFFVARDYNDRHGCTLAEYYIKHYYHLIPDDVEIWEYDEETREGRCVRPGEG